MVRTPLRLLFPLLCVLARAAEDHNLRVNRALSSGDEPTLLAALADRGAALGSLLASLNVSSALALARGAPRGRSALSPAARALLLDEWASATVDVETLRGVPLPGARAAPPHYVHLTFPGGRRVQVHPASVAFAGLPAAGAAPVQGFFFNNEFVADRAGAECGAPAAGGAVECVVGGAARTFASAGEAEAEVAALRRTGARGLQMGADPAATAMQPYFEPSFTQGARTVLILNVRLRGQSATHADVCTMASVRAAAAYLPERHGQRAFGALALVPTLVDCVLELGAASYATSYELHAAAKAAAQGAASCAPLTAAQVAAFKHVVVFHPRLSGANFGYGGLGSMFGVNTWLNGPNTANEAFVAHEIGHNYGLFHASAWPVNDAFEEYGDFTDVMGDAATMAVGDYSSVAKLAMGWIPRSRFLALHPHGAAATTGLVSNASFPLAALDRNNAIGVDPFHAYPANVALAARLTIPPHFRIASAVGAAGDNAFAFLHYRAKALVPGIYMVEASVGEFGMRNPLLVCNEPLCREQAPLAGAHDAFVYDRNGTRALIGVGALTTSAFPAAAGVTNTDLQNSAYHVTVSYLGANGRKLGEALPPSCNAGTGMCASNTYTDVTATGTFARSLSAAAPVALFRISSPSNGAVTIRACSSGTPPYSAPIGVSAFLSGFPTAHAFYTGSVGVSGDAAAPGVVPSSPYPQCASTTVAVAAGRVVWAAVGSPGSFRGATLSASVTITVGGLPAPAVGDLASVEEDDFTFNGHRYSGGYQKVTSYPPCGVCDAGSPVFLLRKDFYAWSRDKAYLVKLAGQADYTIALASAASMDGTYAAWRSAPAHGAYGSAPLAKMGACPRGSFKSGGACALCPVPGQSSTGSALSAQDCFCPTGFLPTSAGCAGQELGGPNAVSAAVAAFPPCPVGSSLSSSGACVDCPAGAAPALNSYSSCAFKFYRVIEVVPDGTTPSYLNWMRGIFTRNALAAGSTTFTYTRSGVAGDTDTWRISPTTGSWQLCVSPACKSFYAGVFSATLSVGALQLVTSGSVAFCDSVGDSTVNAQGNRVCYCGENMQRDANFVCQACPSGQTRSLGGAASTVEVCSNAPTASPSGAANVVVPGGACGGPSGSLTAPARWKSHAGAGVSNYGDGWMCAPSTFVAPEGSIVTFTLLYASAETCCDKVYLYDGASAGSNQVGALTAAGQSVTSSSRHLTVQFTSDGSIVGLGYMAAVSFSTPLYAPSPSGSATATGTPSGSTRLSGSSSSSATASSATMGSFSPIASSTLGSYSASITASFTVVATGGPCATASATGTSSATLGSFSATASSTATLGSFSASATATASAGSPSAQPTPSPCASPSAVVSGIALPSPPPKAVGSASATPSATPLTKVVTLDITLSGFSVNGTLPAPGVANLTAALTAAVGASCSSCRAQVTKVRRAANKEVLYSDGVARALAGESVVMTALVGAPSESAARAVAAAAASSAFAATLASELDMRGFKGLTVSAAVVSAPQPPAAAPTAEDPNWALLYPLLLGLGGAALLAGGTFAVVRLRAQRAQLRAQLNPKKEAGAGGDAEFFQGADVQEGGSDPPSEHRGEERQDSGRGTRGAALPPSSPLEGGADALGEEGGGAVLGRDRTSRRVAAPPPPPPEDGAVAFSLNPLLMARSRRAAAPPPPPPVTAPWQRGDEPPPTLTVRSASPPEPAPESEARPAPPSQHLSRRAVAPPPPPPLAGAFPSMRRSPSPPPPPPSRTAAGCDADDVGGPLPLGWLRLGPDAGGRFWYDHPEARVTQWERPVLAGDSGFHAPALPPGWERAGPDPATGRIYYDHPAAGVTTWDVPTGPPPGALRSPAAPTPPPPPPAAPPMRSPSQPLLAAVQLLATAGAGADPSVAAAGAAAVAAITGGGGDVRAREAALVASGRSLEGVAEDAVAAGAPAALAAALRAHADDPALVRVAATALRNIAAADEGACAAVAASGAGEHLAEALQWHAESDVEAVRMVVGALLNLPRDEQLARFAGVAEHLRAARAAHAANPAARAVLNEAVVRLAARARSRILR